MLVDGVQLISGSDIKNMVADSGATFPLSPDDGQMYYVNSTSQGNEVGLYIYQTVVTEWVRVFQTGDSVTFAANFQGGSGGDLIYQTATNVSGFIAPTTNGYLLALVSGIPTWVAAVNSITGTANQIIASASTGNVTLSLPQSINSGAAPTFVGTNFSAIPNAALSNSSVTVNGTVISLGGSATVVASAGTLTGTSIASGVVSSSLTSVGTIGTGVWQGTPIANAYIANDSITIGSTNAVLGSTVTTIAGLTSVTSTTFVGALTGNASTATSATSATNATNAANVAIGGATGAGPFYPTMVNGSTGNLAMDVDTGWTLDPATCGMTIPGTLTITSGTVTNLTTPVNSSDAATKSYVDAATVSFNVHTSVVAATTANLTATYTAGSADLGGGTGIGATLTNSGAQAAFAVDGYSALLNDRILVKNQSTATQNGIYTVTTVGTGSTNWVLTRATDYDNSAAGQVHAGDFTWVSEGTVNANTGYVETAIGTFTGEVIKISTDSISYTQFSGAGTYLAGTGVSLVGNTFSNAGVLSITSNSGISTNVTATGNVTLTNTGVTSLAGTASQVTVSAATGGVTLSLPSSVTISGTMQAGTFSGAGTSLTGTASSLVAGGVTVSNLTSSIAYGVALASSVTTVGYSSNLTFNPSTSTLLVDGPVTATGFSGSPYNLCFSTPDTGATSQYMHLGTWTCTQNGMKLMLDIVFGAGYNGVNNTQTAEYEVMFQTSNGSSFQAGSSGNFFAGGNVWARGGGNAVLGVLVIQNSTSSYDFYVNASAFSGLSYYKVNGNSGGSWANSSALVGTSTPSGNNISLPIYASLDSTSTSAPSLVAGGVSVGFTSANTVYDAVVATSTSTVGYTSNVTINPGTGALSAASYNGLTIATSGAQPTGNQIVRTDGNGYLYTFYINSGTNNSENPTISQVICTNGSDNFYRKSSIASFTSAVQTAAGVAAGTWGINITGASTTVTNNAGRTDPTAYPVVWATGATSPLYNCSSVTIQSSTGTLGAANVLIAGAYGLTSPTTYGSFGCTGAAGAWAGVSFNSSYNNQNLMISTTSLSSGVYSVANGWTWRFDGTALAAGTVPAGLVTSGTLNGPIGVSGAFNASTTISAGTNVTTSTGDISANRGGSGVIFLGTSSNYCYFSGSIYSMPGAQLQCTSFDATSDRNLKTNIAPITGALAKLEQLNGVTFNWNEKAGATLAGTVSTGLIAQDVEAVLPEAVSRRVRATNPIRRRRLARARPAAPQRRQ